MSARIPVAVLFFGIMAGLAAAQAPTYVTAEAIEIIRMKPNTAKIYLGVESKAPTATEAAEANVASRKELVSTVDKLGLKTVAVKTLQQKVTKDRDNSIRLRGGFGPGGNPAPVAAESFCVIQPVIFTVSETDPVKLVETVEKVCQTAANLGITSDKGIVDTGTYNSIYGETKYGARIVYSAKEGWDDVLAPALKKATERAIRNAAALAEGAKLRAGDILSVDDLTDSGAMDPSATDLRTFNPRSLGMPLYTEDELQEGDLVRKVRVRVKVAMVK